MSQYLLAWMIYLAACSVLLWVGWGWTRRLPFAVLRNPLRAVAAALLLTPVLHEDVSQMLVPAWVVGGLAWLAGDREVAVRALLILAVVVILALLVAVILSLMWNSRRRKGAAGTRSVSSGGSGD